MVDMVDTDDAMDRVPCPQPWRKADGTVNPAGDPAGRVLTAEVDGTRGLLLPVRQSTTAAVAVLAVLGVALLVLAAFLFAAGGVVAVIGGVLAVLFGLLVVISCVAALRKPRTAAGLLLTPDGLLLNWATPPVRLPWAQVREVRPVAVRLGRANTSASLNYLGVVTADPDAAGERHRGQAERFGKDLAFALSTRTLLVDQLVALRALTHYLDHPEHRAELGTGAAVTRLHG